MASVDSIVAAVFAQIDKNGDGDISLEEFRLGFHEHPEICGFFKQF